MDAQQQFDSELQTYFLKIKHEIKQEHVEYLKNHPELKQILNDFTSQVLLEKVGKDSNKYQSQPDDVYNYARDYFSYFNQEKDKKVYKLFIVSGPSGVGKGTLLTKLIENYPNIFEFSVSYTTRSPRPGEVHGKHYYFVSKEEFQKEIVRNAFLENCEVHGNHYGTHMAQVSDIKKKGKICLIEIDVQGAEKINNKLQDDCNFLFINAVSQEELRKRLIGRHLNKGSETPEVIEKRVNNSIKEVQKFKELGIYTELVNDNLDHAYESLINYLKDKYPEQNW